MINKAGSEYYYNVRFVYNLRGLNLFGLEQFNDRNMTKEERKAAAVAKAEQLLMEGKTGVYVTELFPLAKTEVKIWGSYL